MSYVRFRPLAWLSVVRPFRGTGIWQHYLDLSVLAASVGVHFYLAAFCGLYLISGVFFNAFAPFYFPKEIWNAHLYPFMH